ncbi:MAG: polyprenyl synthetase family protein [Anaerolineae bacterium]|jgi:geranylgeranyl diphosphate synthase type I
MTVDLNPYLEAVEKELSDSLSPRDERALPLYQMMQYHMGWLDCEFAPENAPRGKRLRPAMCLLACEAVSGEWRQALPAAAAIELIHNFSLLHDDIEDNSETRRHRATVWSLWGIAQGINTGDAMWALSRLAVYRLSDLGHPAETVLSVARRLDETCLELCTGQYLDLHFEERDGVTLPEYERMISGKTAALLSASLTVGALLGGAPAEVVHSYGEFGRELGLAFQITDDILGIWGDPAVTGKSAASDIIARKKTLPVLYALQWEQERGHDDLERIYTGPSLGNGDVSAVLSLLERAGALDYVRHRAAEHHRRTMDHLQATGVTGPAQDALRALALSILDRSH